MPMLNPYVSFDGNAREALSFYHSVLGGELEISTFADFADSGMPVSPEDRDKVMHGRLTAEGGMTLMAADTPAGMDYEGPVSGITLSLSGGAEDTDRLTDAFGKLSEGGEVGVPLDKAPWGDTFGMFTDRFGVAWMIDIGPEPS